MNLANLADWLERDVLADLPGALEPQWLADYLAERLTRQPDELVEALHLRARDWLAESNRRLNQLAAEAAARRSAQAGEE